MTRRWRWLSNWPTQKRSNRNHRTCFSATCSPTFNYCFYYFSYIFLLSRGLSFSTVIYRCFLYSGYHPFWDPKWTLRLAIRCEIQTFPNSRSDDIHPSKHLALAAALLQRWSKMSIFMFCSQGDVWCFWGFKNLQKPRMHFEGPGRFPKLWQWFHKRDLYWWWYQNYP